jgi:hypothetical protein
MSVLKSEQKKKTLIKVYQKRKFLDTTIRYFVTKKLPLTNRKQEYIYNIY